MTANHELLNFIHTHFTLYMKRNGIVKATDVYRVCHLNAEPTDACFSLMIHNILQAFGLAKPYP